MAKAYGELLNVINQNMSSKEKASSLWRIYHVVYDGWDENQSFLIELVGIDTWSETPRDKAD